jgi:hypothetical protein
MAGGEVRTLVLTIAIITLLAVGLYMVDPTMCGLVKAADGFMDANPSTLPPNATGSMNGMPTVDATSMSGEEQVMANAANPNAELTQQATQQATALVNSLQQTLNQGSPASMAGFKDKKQEGFANLEDITGPAEFGSTPNPNGCYPRDQLTPGELLPKDGNSTWAQQNPMGTGSLKGKNFLSAGALVGVNTVGQSLRNANQQLRSEPPNPQVPVSVFFNSTIEPDTNRRDMEIN